MLIMITYFIIYSNNRIFGTSVITPSKIFCIVWAIYAESSLYSGNPEYFLLQILYIFGFTLGLCVWPLLTGMNEHEKKYKKINNKTKKYYNTIAISIFLIGLSILTIKITNFGIIQFIAASRLDIALITRGDFVFSLSDTIMTSGYLFSMSISIIEKRRMSWVQVIMAFIMLAYSIMTISKAQLIFTVMPVGYLLSERGRIRAVHIGFSLILGMFILFIWKPFLGYIFYENRRFDITTIKLPGEITSWMEMYENIKYTEKIFGDSLFQTLLGIVHPFYDYEPLSVWYAKRYVPEIWDMGGGRGFPTIIEGYINFGFLGVFVFGVIIGVYFSCIEKYKRSSLPALIVTIATMCILHKFFRSEFYSIFKTLIWVTIIPGIVIYYISRLRIRA
jgi:oligosaccharide repeat unit polymerase